MNRQEKEALVESLKNGITNSQASFIVVYRGLSVPQSQALRRQLRQQGARLQIAKARLMKIAVDGIEDSQAMKPLFHDQVGLVFASEEVSPVAKILKDYAKEYEKFSVVGGYFESHVIDEKSVLHMASLPSKEVLLSQFIGLLNMPATQLACVLVAPIRQLLFALKQIEENKAKESQQA